MRVYDCQHAGSLLEWGGEEEEDRQEGSERRDREKGRGATGCRPRAAVERRLQSRQQGMCQRVGAGEEAARGRKVGSGKGEGAGK